MEQTQDKRILSFVKLRAFIRDPKYTPSEKIVMLDLILYAGVSGHAFPSEKTLGNDIGRGDRQVRNILNSLRTKGALEGWFRRGYSKSNLYLLFEELFFRDDTEILDPVRNLPSSENGDLFPFDSGTEFPPNINNIESNKLTESHSDNDTKKILYFSPCGNCEKGYIYDSDDNSAVICKCLEDFRRSAYR